jgi:hypothetical protein
MYALSLPRRVYRFSPLLVQKTTRFSCESDKWEDIETEIETGVVQNGQTFCYAIAQSNNFESNRD